MQARKTQFRRPMQRMDADEDAQPPGEGEAIAARI
jgi:hypothetical protein